MDIRCAIKKAKVLAEFYQREAFRHESNGRNPRSVAGKKTYQERADALYTLIDVAKAYQAEHEE